MREIGGYLGFEELIHREYYPQLTALNTARSAMLYIMKARGVKKIYIPYYLCGSVARVLEREGYAYEYYHVGEDFMPAFNGTIHEGECLYVVNYYGRITDDKAVMLKAEYGNIMLDNVQAFFQRPQNGIDTVYSCRKFFGVPDGAYAATEAEYPHEIPQDVSAGRMKHILGRCEGRSASEYYGDFKRSDESYASAPVMKMSWLTHNLLGAIDYERAKMKREENYMTLHNILGGSNKLPEFFPEGSFAYPYYCPDGISVRKRLAAKKIFVATLWPFCVDCGDSVAEDYAANILPLPCDQRYSVEDMRFVAGEVMKIRA
ncbi:MAG: hypothetical protein IJQ58_02490 [Synergistaceae bacterium]|nr:hypothetical protein [Synergistaceae bacterium]